MVQGRVIAHSPQHHENANISNLLVQLTFESRGPRKNALALPCHHALQVQKNLLTCYHLHICWEEVVKFSGGHQLLSWAQTRNFGSHHPNLRKTSPGKNSERLPKPKRSVAVAHGSDLGLQQDMYVCMYREKCMYMYVHIYRYV